MDGTLGVITMFACDFAPTDWMLCSGQLLQVRDYQGLYTLIGNTYGGTPGENFNLPDLRGIAPISVGHGPGLSNFYLAQRAGGYTTTMTAENIPAHAHNGTAYINLPAGKNNDTDTPGPGTFIGYIPAGFSTMTSSKDSMKSATIGGITLATAGSALPIPIMPAYQVVNYIICVHGPFPTRP